MMSRITFDPCIPLAMWFPLALAAAGLVAWYALASRGRLAGRRRIDVLVLMSGAVAVPLLLLLNPLWLERIPPPPGKPLLTVLVDASASMATRDGESGQTRYQEAVRLAQAASSELGQRYEVRVRALSADSSEVEPAVLAERPPDGACTDLAGAIDAALGDERPQGQAVLLVSDGIQNVGGSARLREVAARAKALAAPVFTKTIGGQGGVRDIEVELKRPQEVAFVKQQVPVAVSVRQRGSLASEVHISLRLDDKQIDRRRVKLTANGAVEEVFYVTQKAAGLYRYEFLADTLPGEVTPLNNAASLLVRVIDRPVRVLLLEGKPYWDTKFLVRTLSMDESVELTSVVQLAPGRLLQRKVTRPRQGQAAADTWTVEKGAGKLLSDAATLNSFQIVILGRNADVFLSEEALSRLKKWLNDEEGSLVCFRGAPSSQIGERLGELMPVRWTPGPESRFRVRLTEEGQTRGWLPVAADELSGMPSLAATARPEAKEYLGVVLAASVGSGGQLVPVVTYRPVGVYSSGRVVTIEGAGMWRWAFLPPQYQDRDELYGSLWRSLVRWLVTNVGLLPSERLALRPDKSTFSSEESAAVTLLVRESQWSGGVPRIELSGGPLARPQTTPCRPWGNSPGQYHAELGKLPEGHYQVRVGGAGKEEVSGVAVFDVRGNLRERLDVAAQPETMSWIARESGAVALDQADPSSLARQFEGYLSRSRPERTARTTAWDRWWVLLGAFALWGTAWGVRRWSGLV
jgi:hypothetical protein